MMKIDYWDLVNYSHSLIIAPLFIYIGATNGQVMKPLYKLILYLGIISLLYHAYKTVKNYQDGNTMYIVNLFHVFVIAPLLIYVGLKREKTTYPIPSLMYILGIGALVHFFKKIL